ncbi:MAG: hypothetical protein IJS20_01010 [Bacteroidales bacterium]|nr:hypothetical protein [Bacteroidales bacterium]
MRHLLLTLLLLTLCATSGMAQINLREGFVITLSGDTLHGSIDYRTDRMNMEQCIFIQDGHNLPVICTPTDIQGYRFLDNGRYYVSKTIQNEVTKRDTTLFLEYVVRGQLSLYRQGDSGEGYIFYLENEEGKLAKFKVLDGGETNNERRNKLGEALDMTAKSQSTQKMLWENGSSRYKIIKSVLNYNNEVCPDGSCELFEYRTKKAPKNDRIFFPTISIGYDQYRILEMNKSKHIQTPAIAFSVGADWYFIRISKGFFGRINATYRQTHFYDDSDFLNYYTTFNDNVRHAWRSVNFKLGAGYQWKKYRLQPRLYGGVAYTRTKMRFKTNWRVEPNEFVKEEYIGHETHYENTPEFGSFIGAGLVCPIQNGSLMLSSEFEDTSDLEQVLRTQHISISIGYQFGYGTKR